MPISHFCLQDKTFINSNKVFSQVVRIHHPQQTTPGKTSNYWDASVRFWNKDLTINCLDIWGKSIPVTSEEQVWAIIDKASEYYELHQLWRECFSNPHAEFFSKYLRKNCKFYKATFGDLKLTFTGK